MKWLDRRLLVGPYLTLCLSEAEYLRVMRHCKIKDPPLWVNDGAGASTHKLANAEGNLVCVVCMRPARKKTVAQVHALLVHEAVHVWRFFKEEIGERDAGTEVECYAIQAIAQTLMEAWRDR